MNCRLFVLFVALLSVVLAQNQYWEDEAGAVGGPYDVPEQRFFVPILSDKRSIDQKIRSLKERTANGQFKGILFGRKK